MTRNQSLVCRTLLFLGGGGIAAGAFFLIKGGQPLSKADIFIWTSITLMYLVVFTPFFFSAIKFSNFSSKIPPLALVWVGIIGYVLVSMVIIGLLAKGFSLNAALIMQAILVFLFALDVYCAYFASAHVQNTAEQESAQRQYLDEIKSKSQILSLSLNKLSGEYEGVQKLIKQIIEDIRYISPVDKNKGTDLELKILIALNRLSEFCNSISAGGYSAALESEAQDLQMLVKERKLIRN